RRGRAGDRAHPGRALRAHPGEREDARALHLQSRRHLEAAPRRLHEGAAAADVTGRGRTVPKRSAGLLMYRGAGSDLAVLLVHPGGPFWTKKDLGAWSIPKGEYAGDEDPLAVAQREFAEETGARPHGK